MSTDRSLVLVGGTGRSGTHVLARLLGQHSRFADVPIESRFHCHKRGLPDLLEGRVPLAGFLDKLRGFWWHRVRVDGEPRGLYNLMTRRRFDDAVDRFANRYHGDPLAASRELFWDLLWPVAEDAGKAGLVEMSSHNVREAPTLSRLFERARFVHTVRDGRDAASSVTGKTWGPKRIVPAIDWWADRLRRIELGVRGEEDGIRYNLLGKRLHLVVLDDLVGEERERVYAALLSFVGVEDEPAIRGWFDREMTPESAHQGRWANGLGRLGRARVRRKYERTLQTLEREGLHCARPLLDAYERDG